MSRAIKAKVLHRLTFSVEKARTLARLSPEDRAVATGLPASARPGLPAAVDAQGRLRLPRPFGPFEGAEVAPLGGQRFRAACGLVRTEADLD